VRVTSLDNINADITRTSIDLLLDKRRGYLVDVIYTQCILSRKSRRCCHGIAAMSRNDLLVRFQATFSQNQLYELSNGHSRSTYAPPELSDPAITNIRLMRFDMICCSFTKKCGLICCSASNRSCGVCDVKSSSPIGSSDCVLQDRNSSSCALHDRIYPV